MAISFHPDPGSVLICDYTTGFVPPEMVKKRLCVVITPRLRRREGLCTVVPLSTSEPEPICDFHFALELEREIPGWPGRLKWAKCDMFGTVSHARLSPIGIGRRGDDRRRKYIYPRVTADQLRGIRGGVLCALTFRELTQYL